MPLPEPYASWFEAVVGAPAPEERSATCGDCPMCAVRGFRPNVKCCTYIPSIPNFQVGRALGAGGEAAARVRRRLREGRATDTWLHPTEEEEEAYDAHRERFGATDAVTCPYVTDDGRCAIWAQRNAICATWFCRHDDGEAGAALWDAAADLLHFVEGGVAVWVAGDGYETAAERLASLSWPDIQRIGGAELREKEDALRAAWATVQISPTPGPPRS